MPENDVFSFHVLVGDVEVQEYQHRGQTYIVADLNTAVSYKKEITEVYDGQTYTQKWPVTPYTIKITPKPCTRKEIKVDIFVDGERADTTYVSPRKQR